MTLFEEILENKTYADLISKLPEDERPVILNTLKKFVEDYENNVLRPLKNLDSK